VHPGDVHGVAARRGSRRNARGLGSSLRWRRRNPARCGRHCIGSVLAATASVLGSGLTHPCPHLHRDWAHRCRICTGTEAHPAHICTGTGAHPARICARMPRPFVPAPGVCRGAAQVSRRACVRRDNSRRMAAAVTLQARAEPRAIPAASRSDTCASQRGPCGVNATQHAACNMRHATDNMQQTTCGMQQTTCNRQHATCSIEIATVSMQHATYTHTSSRTKRGTSFFC
jgi:hypothetical protein